MRSNYDYGNRRHRRSVENYYNYYDPPGEIWNKISGRTWDYQNSRKFYKLRDLAFLCLLYIATARSSELCRARVHELDKPAITSRHFKRNGDRLLLRKLPIIKRSQIKSLRDYPTRREIIIPLTGWLSMFGKPILEYILMLKHGEELFKFGYKRGYQITEYITGETQHYLRDMGIKLYYRLYDKNLQDLKKFTGHARIENLFRYLGEGEIEDKLFNKPG